MLKYVLGCFLSTEADAWGFTVKRLFYFFSKSTVKDLQKQPSRGDVRKRYSENM